MDAEKLREMVEAVQITRPAGLGQELLVYREGWVVPGFAWLWATGDGDEFTPCSDADAANAVLAELVGRMKHGTSLNRVGEGEFQFIDSNGDCWASAYHPKALGALWEAFEHDPDLFQTA